LRLFNEPGLRYPRWLGAAAWRAARARATFVKCLLMRFPSRQITTGRLPSDATTSPSVSRCRPGSRWVGAVTCRGRRPITSTEAVSSQSLQFSTPVGSTLSGSKTRRDQQYAGAVSFATSRGSPGYEAFHAGRGCRESAGTAACPHPCFADIGELLARARFAEPRLRWWQQSIAGPGQVRVAAPDAHRRPWPSPQPPIGERPR